VPSLLRQMSLSHAEDMSIDQVPLLRSSSDDISDALIAKWLPRYQAAVKELPRKGCTVHEPEEWAQRYDSAVGAIHLHPKSGYSWCLSAADESADEDDGKTSLYSGRIGSRRDGLRMLKLPSTKWLCKIIRAGVLNRSVSDSTSALKSKFAAQQGATLEPVRTRAGRVGHGGQRLYLAHSHNRGNGPYQLDAQDEMVGGASGTLGTHTPPRMHAH
jgi:hypothetical protein